MRVLFGTWSSSGPLRPLIPTIQAVQAAGHQVAVMGDRGLVGHPELTGIEVRVLPDRGDVIEGFDQARTKRETEALPPDQRPAFEIANFLAYGTALARSAIDTATDFRPDVIVREFAFHAGWLAADALDLPHATFLLIPMSERSMVDWLPDPYRAAHASIARSRSAARSIRQALELFALPPSWFGRSGPPADAALVRPSEPAPTDDGTATRLLDGLGVDRPLVYMTLGTTFADEPGLYRTVLDGVASLEVDVIATTGPALDPDDFSGYPDRVRVTRFVPQTLILPHCQAVVGHAGYGTVFGAMAHGVPMVTVPIASSDNAPNARRLDRAGAARVVDEHERSSEEVAQALTEVLESPSYARAAGALATELAAMPGPESVVAALEDHTSA